MTASLPRPDVLFLDVGDTLVRAHPSWSSVYIEALRAEGVAVEPADLEAAFAASMGTDFWVDDGPYEASEEASWQRVRDFDRAVLARLGHADLPDTVYRAIARQFREIASWHVFPDVMPALDALRVAHVRLAVISNWLWNGPELLHELQLARHFETLVISDRVGYQKPNPGIFSHALEVMGAAPESSVHVGDSYRADVLGARSVGITPVLIHRRRAGDGEPRVAAGIPEGDDVALVHDLFGLLELLGIPRAATAAAGHER